MSFTATNLGAPLDSLLLKVERAKKHILDLEAERDRFFLTNPYAFRHETDVQSGKRTYYLVKAESIPREFSLLISDALHNIRSCLDHIAYQLALVAGAKGKTLRDAYFPIFDSAPEYLSKRSGIVKAFRQDAIKVIDALEPYKGGAGEYFRHISALNNFDKHRLLVTAWSCFEAYTARKSDREFLACFHGGSPDSYRNTFMAAPNRIFPLQAGDKLLTVFESDVDEQMNFILGISFAEPEIVKGNPVIETLHEMTKMVRNLIFDFDRFGLFR